MNTCESCGATCKRRFCSTRCYGQAISTHVTRECAVCGRPFSARGNAVRDGNGRYCSRSCLNRSRRRPLVERFWAAVRRTPGCWLWSGCVDRHGYGVLADGNRRQVRAHRLAFEIHHGSVPTGLLVCHTCDRPGCVNPEHLFVGTNADNMTDKTRKGRQTRGDTHGRSRLSAAAVAAIRAEYGPVDFARRRHPTGLRQLAERYGVAVSTIADALYGRHWRTAKELKP